MDNVYLISRKSEIKMEKVRTEGLFDFYETQISVGSTSYLYYFEIEKGRDICYYNKLGCTTNLRQKYAFRITPGFHTPEWAKGAVFYQIYVDHNKAVDGDAYLKMALELEPQDGEDCYHRGRIYEYEKNYEAARDELKTAMEQGYEDAMLLLGRVYLEMEDPASARSMYQEYLQKSEQGAKAYNGLAMCDIYDGAYDSALENIAQGLKENSKEDEQGLLYNEIVAYEYKRDFATAKEKMKIYLEQYPEDEAALRENEFLSTR